LRRNRDVEKERNTRGVPNRHRVTVGKRALAGREDTNAKTLKIDKKHTRVCDVNQKEDPKETL